MASKLDWNSSFTSTTVYVYQHINTHQLIGTAKFPYLHNSEYIFVGLFPSFEYMIGFLYFN